MSQYTNTLDNNEGFRGKNIQHNLKCKFLFQYFWLA